MVPVIYPSISHDTWIFTGTVVNIKKFVMALQCEPFILTFYANVKIARCQYCIRNKVGIMSAGMAWSNN
jgi:hypothetical protein